MALVIHMVVSTTPPLQEAMLLKEHSGVQQRVHRHKVQQHKNQELRQSREHSALNPLDLAKSVAYREECDDRTKSSHVASHA